MRALDPTDTVAIMGRTRPALVALVATLTQLVVVAAVGNQSTTSSLLRHGGGGSFGRLVLESMASFAWRFTPLHGGTRIWIAQLAGIAVLLVVVFLVTLVAASGRPLVLQVFMLTWFGVVLGALAGNVVRAFVLPSYYVLPGAGRLSYALFYSSGVLVYGLGFGLLVGAVAAAAAAVLRRPEPAAAWGGWGDRYETPGAVPGAAVPGYGGTPAGYAPPGVSYGGPHSTPHDWPGTSSAEQTATLPGYRDSGQDTVGYRPPEPASPAEETQQLRRPDPGSPPGG